MGPIRHIYNHKAATREWFGDVVRKLDELAEKPPEFTLTLTTVMVSGSSWIGSHDYESSMSFTGDFPELQKSIERVYNYYDYTFTNIAFCAEGACKVYLSKALAHPLQWVKLGFVVSVNQDLQTQTRMEVEYAPEDVERALREGTHRSLEKVWRILKEQLYYVLHAAFKRLDFYKLRRMPHRDAVRALSLKGDDHYVMHTFPNLRPSCTYEDIITGFE